MAEINPKIDSELNLTLELSKETIDKSEALSAGYNPETNTWSVIVKYHGDLSENAAVLPMTYEILSDKYAIVSIPPDLIESLANMANIEYIEKPRLLGTMLEQGLRSSCITPVQTNYGLTGKGVIIGIIDSGIDYSHVLSTFLSALL